MTITSLSNPRPPLVSGDDVLIAISVPDGIAPDQVRVARNGADVTPAFAEPDATLRGLVTGLTTGRNDIRARVVGPGDRARLTVVDHPIAGPVFSGAKQVPYFCQTTAFGLAAATPPLCSAPTVVSYEYRTTAGAYAPLADPTARPVDLASATVNGHPVPYIVRVETGTIDRAVYQIAALSDGRARRRCARTRVGTTASSTPATSPTTRRHSRRTSRLPHARRSRAACATSRSPASGPAARPVPGSPATDQATHLRIVRPRMRYPSAERGQLEW